MVHAQIKALNLPEQDMALITGINTHTHTHNFSFRAEGPCQSSDRAELRCFLRVLRWAPIPIEYLTDNMAVQIGYDKLAEGKRPRSVWKDHNAYGKE